MLCRKSHSFLSKWKHIFYSSSSCFCWHVSDCLHMECVEKNQPKAQVMNYHRVIKDVKWWPQGLSLLSCSYDRTVRLVDVDKGTLVSTFEENEAVGSTKFHPKDCNLFLTGGLEGSLKLWDIRGGMLVYEYVRDRGPILDIEFSVNGQQFISSSDVSGSSPSENATTVWDVRRQVPLLNQVNILYFDLLS